MIPRLHIEFPHKLRRVFRRGVEYTPNSNEYLVNHARSGIVMALRTTLPNGGRVGVVAYNCHTVANAVVQGGCTPVFVDVTSDLHIDVQHLSKQPLDAIVVTNLFGIHNELDAIRQAQPNAIIIVDNAHGYGLPVEGDFCVYSINQGKFPSLGEGGLLMVNNPQYQAAIDAQYADLKGYSMLQEAKLYITMLLKAIMHLPWIYKAITLRLKQQRQPVACREQVILKRMAKGVSRMYQHYLASGRDEIIIQARNAACLQRDIQAHPDVQAIWWGENAFMAVARCHDVAGLQLYFAERGLEAATHFLHAIDWAMEFGYVQGTCPVSEKLTKELLMIPTYKKI